MTIRSPGGFHVVHSGVLPRAGDDEDLFGARGLLPTLDLPTLSIPGVGQLTSVLGLPSPDTSTTSSSSTTSVPAQTTSTSDTISLTTSSTATSTSSSSSSTTSDTTSTASSTTPLLPSSSDATTATPPSSATATPTSSQQSTVTVTSASDSSTSSAAATQQADAAPKSFLQNKALSVGVITAASLVGLVLIIALATWAIRKRRNDRLNQDIIDFSNAGLVNEHDTEKGAGGYGAGAGNVETGSTESGDGTSFGHGNTVPPPVQPRQMYQDMGYGAAAAYGVPSRQDSRNQPAGPYGAQGGYGGAYGAYQQSSSAYQQPNTTYNNWGYGYPAGAQYDQAYGGMDDAYSGYTDAQANVNVAGYGAGAQQTSATPLQRRPSAQRKPAPQLDIALESSVSQRYVTSPESSVSTGSASPPPPEKGSGYTYPKLPAPGPLPDEFGSGISFGSPTEAQEPRRLVVRND
ncbi:hypothetical protein LXA43DRAFT_1096785 [Ganoderma leucocontextum]|nr:hypothetical protein LXA43DRAFT_1096785 [Ganoderma leucocontextum]